jgi:hypothetical protein
MFDCSFSLIVDLSQLAQFFISLGRLIATNHIRFFPNPARRSPTTEAGASESGHPLKDLPNPFDRSRRRRLCCTATSPPLIQMMIKEPVGWIGYACVVRQRIHKNAK